MSLPSAGGHAAVVVVGAGQAGTEVAFELRARGYAGTLTLVGDEPGLPYARPPLSKAFLLDESGEGDLAIRPAHVYDDQRIRRVTGKAVSIDRQGRKVHFDDGPSLPYDALVLATGGRPRRLVGQGLGQALNVHYLKTLPDANGLKERLRVSSKIVIIGGGYIGLEAAAVARRVGLLVTVLEAQPRLLARVTSEPVSDFYRKLHVSHGVEVRLSTHAAGFEFDAAGNVVAVILSDGERVACDLLLVGIGQVPNDGLAAQAGLVVDDGIVVDAACHSSDPRILAIGDCTRHPCGPGGALRRIESVDNALEQARTAAAALTANPLPPRTPPWFWSNQFDAKLQTVGLYDAGTEVVVRGDPDADGSFGVFYLRGGRLVAADIVSRPRDFAAARKLVASQVAIPRALLVDTAVPLRDLAAGTAGVLPAAPVNSPSPIRVSA